MTESITIDSVFLTFGQKDILRGVYLDFKNNKTLGLLGRNGSGKSCLLKIIIGEIQPQSKCIKYKGRLLGKLYKEKGLINYLPQHEFRPKTVSLVKLLDLYRINQEEFLKEYPFLKKNIFKKFYNLSGGERRIIEVLIVLESDTKFSILDEPFSNIMPKYIDLVKDRITKLKNRKGILLTDHQYRNVRVISDDLLLIDGGIARNVQSEEDLITYGYLR